MTEKNVLDPMSPAQSRAARALLGLSQSDLANLAFCSLSTIANFESGSRAPRAATLNAIQNVYKARGVRLLARCDEGGEGVRMAL